MSKKIEKTIMEFAAPFAEKMGFELVDVEYNPRKGADSELVIYIDKQGGVTVDDCEAFSKSIDAPIDELDPIEESYILCVSSPGIDRPLKTEKDFQKNIDSEVDVRLYRKTDGRKEFTGILRGYGAETVSVETEGQLIELARGDIAIIRPHINF